MPDRRLASRGRRSGSGRRRRHGRRPSARPNARDHWGQAVPANSWSLVEGPRPDGQGSAPGRVRGRRRRAGSPIRAMGSKSVPAKMLSLHPRNVGGPAPHRQEAVTAKGAGRQHMTEKKKTKTTATQKEEEDEEDEDEETDEEEEEEGEEEHEDAEEEEEEEEEEEDEAR